jgi:preprotein translocase subunit SecG
MAIHATNDETRLEKLRARAGKIIFWANIAMIAMIVIHDTDHVRQAANWCYTISAQLWLVNVSVYVPSLIALALLRRGKGAGIATMINGLLVGAAFSEVHLWRPSIPVWGIWNDNFFILGADRISWTILALTVLVGALVSAAGAYALGMQWAARRG